MAHRLLSIVLVACMRATSDDAAIANTCHGIKYDCWSIEHLGIKLSITYILYSGSVSHSQQNIVKPGLTYGDRGRHGSVSDEDGGRADNVQRE